MVTVKECPYGSGQCPKVTDIDDTLRTLSKQFNNLSRIVYVLCGVIVAQCGIILW